MASTLEDASTSSRDERSLRSQGSRGAHSARSGRSRISEAPSEVGTFQKLTANKCSAIFQCKTGNQQQSFVCFTEASRCRRPNHKTLPKASGGDFYQIERSTPRHYDGELASRLSPREFQQLVAQRREDNWQGLQELAAASPWQKALAQSKENAQDTRRLKNRKVSPKEPTDSTQTRGRKKTVPPTSLRGGSERSHGRPKC